jgi:ATP-dependent DNA helicase RecG
VGDLLRYFPRRYLDRTRVSQISELVAGQEATLKGEIVASGMMRGRRPRFEATLSDGSGQLTLVFFRQPRWFERTLRKGVIVACTGTPTLYGFEQQMVHPEFEVLDTEDDPLGPDRGRIVPIYPGTGEMAGTRMESRFFRRLIEPLLAGPLPEELPDLLPPEGRARMELPTVAEAVRQIHFPPTLEAAEAARRLFALEELFVLQLLLATRRGARTEVRKPQTYSDLRECDRRLIQALPFALTPDQEQVLEEIRTDLASPHPMQRLLQGDVGAGKTVVAACALHAAVRSGYQAALMAPTELLAEQHYQTLSRWLVPVGVTPELLTGSLPAQARREVVARLADGRAGLVVGTHALIQEGVKFQNLALAVVDEQHRFGVRQRSELASRGQLVDVLVMTATPIPRTLQLVLYGDLDVSSIRHLPPGRRDVTTRVITDRERATLWRWLNDRIEKGDQAYVVYPIIDESEKQDLRAATREFEVLRSSALPGKRVALLHGRTETEERRRTMQSFRDGQLDVLVATTVIEIGVDVANANIMVIEHAERFGLSQLHQLRGRVRRGTKRAYCVAVTPGGAQDTTMERLRRFAETDDGFEIAEADLALRGPGDLTGARQSGLPLLRVASPATDLHLIEQARTFARDVCQADPRLSHPAHARLRAAVDFAQHLWAAG